MKKLYSFTETTLVAFLGVIVFTFLNMPLPRLIGSLVTTAIRHITTQRKLTWPSNLKVIAMIPLGCMVGISFTREALLEMRGYLPSMVTVTLLTIAFSLFSGWVYSRTTGLDLRICIMATPTVYVFHLACTQLVLIEVCPGRGRAAPE